MATTPRTTLDRLTTHGPLEVSSFHRIRTPRAGAPVAPARRPGASPARDPRGDLQMFELTPPARPVRAASIDELAPLLPPVISEPPRSRRQTSSGRPARPLSASAAHSAHSAQPAAAGGRRSSVRLTLRGWAVALGLAVAGLAATSALTNASAEPAVSVPSAQVVVQPGESLQDVASRAADGRSVTEVADGIRAANGLPAGVQPEAGEILLVPGS